MTSHRCSLSKNSFKEFMVPVFRLGFRGVEMLRPSLTSNSDSKYSNDYYYTGVNHLIASRLLPGGVNS